jgi:hypothetical protein
VTSLAPYGLPELSIGGGLGVAYVEGERAPTITQWGDAVRKACADAGVTARITASPGARSWRRRPSRSTRSARSKTCQVSAPTCRSTAA